MDKISVLAIIPARGGSKGIKKKNIVSLGGRPLIAYTLQALQDAKHKIDHIVSTDDEEISDIVCLYGGNVPYLRPVELGADDSNVVDVIKDVLAKTRNIYEYVLLLQPTAPLRSANDIDAVIDLAMLHHPGSICSFTKLETYHPWYMYYLKDGNKLEQVVSTMPGKPRQEFPEVVWRNGAIYMVQTKAFIKESRFITDDCLPYIMPRERSVNIDTLDDLRLAELYLKNEKLKSKNAKKHPRQAQSKQLKVKSS